MRCAGAEQHEEPRTEFQNTRPAGCKRKNPNTVAAALLRPIKLPDRHGRRPDTARETPCYLRARSGLFSRVRDRRARWEGHRRRPATYCDHRSEEHTSELQSLMRISYAVFCLKKKKPKLQNNVHKTKTKSATT